MFEPGDKVKCVNATWPEGVREHTLGAPCPLDLGAVYTVVAGFSKGAIGVHKSGQPLTQAALQLEEVSTPYADYLYGGADIFPASWFRKLPKIEQGLELLKAITEGSKIIELEREEVLL